MYRLIGGIPHPCSAETRGGYPNTRRISLCIHADQYISRADAVLQWRKDPIDDFWSRRGRELLDGCSQPYIIVRSTLLLTCAKCETRAVLASIKFTVSFTQLTRFGVGISHAEIRRCILPRRLLRMQ